MGPGGVATQLLNGRKHLAADRTSRSFDLLAYFWHFSHILSLIRRHPNDKKYFLEGTWYFIALSEVSVKVHRSSEGLAHGLLGFFIHDNLRQFLAALGV